VVVRSWEPQEKPEENGCGKAMKASGCACENAERCIREQSLPLLEKPLSHPSNLPLPCGYHRGNRWREMVFKNFESFDEILGKKE